MYYGDAPGIGKYASKKRGSWRRRLLFGPESGMAFVNGEEEQMISTLVTESGQDQSNDQQFEELLRQAEAQWHIILRDVSARIAGSGSVDVHAEK